MHIININHITVNYAGREIFRDLTWAIGDRDRVGLVGPNGAGKSSLMKAIVGQVPKGVTLYFLRLRRLAFFNPASSMDLPPRAGRALACARSMRSSFS
jgi:ABC transport system ATP-binding/permease protein